MTAPKQRLPSLSPYAHRLRVWIPRATNTTWSQLLFIVAVLGALAAWSFWLRYNASLQISYPLAPDAGNYLAEADKLRGRDYWKDGFYLPPLVPAFTLLLLQFWEPVESVRLTMLLVPLALPVPAYLASRAILKDPILAVLPASLLIMAPIWSNLLAWGNYACVVALAAMLLTSYAGIRFIESPSLRRAAFLGFSSSLIAGSDIIPLYYSVAWLAIAAGLTLLFRRRLGVPLHIAKWVPVFGIVFTLPYLPSLLNIGWSLRGSSNLTATITDTSVWTFTRELWDVSFHLWPIWIVSAYVGIVAALLGFIPLRVAIVLGALSVALTFFTAFPTFAYTPARPPIFWMMAGALWLAALLGALNPEFVRIGGWLGKHATSLTACVSLLICVPVFLSEQARIREHQAGSYRFYSALDNDILASADWMRAKTNEDDILIVVTPVYRGVDYLLNAWMSSLAERATLDISREPDQVGRVIGTYTREIARYEAASDVLTGKHEPDEMGWANDVYVFIDQDANNAERFAFLRSHARFDEVFASGGKRIYRVTGAPMEPGDITPPPVIEPPTGIPMAPAVQQCPGTVLNPASPRAAQATYPQPFRRTTVDNQQSQHLNATQGWVLFHVVPDWSSATPPSNYPTIFGWHTEDGRNSLALYYRGAERTVGTARLAGDQGAATRLAFVIQTGVPMTIIYSWTPSEILVDVNGGEAVECTLANAIPDMASAPTFEIGSGLPFAEPLGATIVSCAWGSGTLTPSERLAITELAAKGPLSRDDIQAAGTASVVTFAWDGRVPNSPKYCDPSLPTS